jgi:hypothetical protein
MNSGAAILILTRTASVMVVTLKAVPMICCSMKYFMHSLLVFYILHKLFIKKAIGAV